MKGTKRQRQTEASERKGRTVSDGFTKLQGTKANPEETKKGSKGYPQEPRLWSEAKISMQAAGEKAWGSTVGMKMLPKGDTEPSPGTVGPEGS